MKALFLLLLFSGSALGQSRLYGAKRAGFSDGFTAASGPTCDFVCATPPTYIWTNWSLASGVMSQSTDWIDGISASHFKVYSASTVPTNSIASNGGIWFKGDVANCAITNSGVALNSSANWTVAWFISNWQNQSADGSIGSFHDGSIGFFANVSGNLNVFFSGPHIIGGFTQNAAYQLIASHASSGTMTIYTNKPGGGTAGVASAGTISSMPNWTLQNIGNDGSYGLGDDPFQGRIQNMLIWPGTALSSTDASNYVYWCSQNNQ